MKNLTASVSSFEDLILGGYLYVDKTECLWQLVQERKGSYFLAHPRRFGKSLTISTLEAIFQGRRELFQGLAIDSKPYDWKPFPIIHLNFADCAVDNADELREYLYLKLYMAAQNAKVHPCMEKSQLGLSFSNLISSMDGGKGVVILVDEYDKPLFNMLGNNAAVEKTLPVLKGFYSAIKANNDLERFVFVTGVTKFCHVSLFSDLNNLRDISMEADFATMLGYTQQEFEQYFHEWIADTEKRQTRSHEEFLAEIRSWYDGYRFEETAESVYNPASLALFFLKHGEFANHWFETGTPTFLMELVRERNFNFNNLLDETVPLSTFEALELNDIDPVALLYQTGYLTIQGTRIKYGRKHYWLNFPNREVCESFSSRILNAYASRPQREVGNFCTHLTDAVVSGDLLEFQKALEVFFAGIPYDVHHKNEANFQNIFFAVFKLMGFNIHAESRTANGRIDALVETDKDIYLFEFKLNKDDTALAQIKEREYFKPYLLSTKKLTLIGANFDTETGRLSNWQCEAVR